MDNSERLKRIQEYIDSMPSLSTTANKVVQVCNQPNTSANDLNKIISLDPVLTGQVLKLINSAYYSLPNKITSVTRAIVVLGLNTIKNLALSSAILDGLRKHDKSALSMDLFWSHSLCAGVMAKALAGLKRIPPSVQEEYFIAGLLHDLGKIPLSTCFPNRYGKMLEILKIKNIPLVLAEKKVFGLNHCEAGKMIVEKWRLSEQIIDVLEHHHNPENAAEENQFLVSGVAIGNFYSYFAEIGNAGDIRQEPSNIESILQIVGFEWDGISELDEQAKDAIEKAQIFLQMGKGD